MKSKVLLIGGTSHSGKSTLAQALAEQLEWDYQSTDKLARHPGFPWVGPDGVPRPANVIEHYQMLSVPELLSDVLAHYERNVVPKVQVLVQDVLSGKTANGLVLEGSALWPEFVAGLARTAGVQAFWLTANDSLYVQRIYARSEFASASEDGKYLIQKFLDRTLLYNRRMQEKVIALKLPFIDIQDGQPLEALLQQSLQMIEC